jgi:hypothetical protein
MYIFVPGTIVLLSPLPTIAYVIIASHFVGDDAPSCPTLPNTAAAPAGCHYNVITNANGCNEYRLDCTPSGAVTFSPPSTVNPTSSSCPQYKLQAPALNCHYVYDTEPATGCQVNPHQQCDTHDCGENEVWNECATACPRTCRTSPQLCTKQCVAGCQCQPEYVRHDDTKMCVRNDQCNASSSATTPVATIHIGRYY